MREKSRRNSQQCRLPVSIVLTFACPMHRSIVRSHPPSTFVVESHTSSGQPWFPRQGLERASRELAWLYTSSREYPEDAFCRFSWGCRCVEAVVDGSPVAATSRSRSVSFEEYSKLSCLLLGYSCLGSLSLVVRQGLCR